MAAAFKGGQLIKRGLRAKIVAILEHGLQNLRHAVTAHTQLLSRSRCLPPHHQNRWLDMSLTQLALENLHEFVTAVHQQRKQWRIILIIIPAPANSPTGAIHHTNISNQAALNSMN